MQGKTKLIVVGGLIVVLAAGATFLLSNRVTAATVIERAQGAWKDLRSYRGTVSMKMGLGQMDLSFKLQQWYAAPDRFRMEMDLGMFQQTQVLDGDNLLMQMPMVDKIIRVTGIRNWQKSAASAPTQTGGMDPRQNGSAEWIMQQLNVEEARLGKRTEVAGRPCFVLIQPGQDLPMPQMPGMGGEPSGKSGPGAAFGNNPFFQSLKDGEIHIAIDQTFYLPLQWAVVDTEGKEVMSYTFEKFEPNVDLPENTFTLDTKGKEVVDIQADAPEKFASALMETLMAGSTITLEEARKKVDFPLFVPTKLGSPKRVEYIEQFGRQIVTLHFEREGKKIKLEEIPIAQAMPLEEAKSLPGIKVLPLDKGREGIYLDGSLVGSNTFTWQDSESGVDFSLYGENLTEEEFVAIAQSMKKAEP